MDGVQRLYLDRSIRSLASSTYVEVKGWGYRATLRGLCSDLISHHSVEFHAVEEEKFQPPPMVWNKKFALFFGFGPPSEPPPVRVDGYISEWQDCGVVPYSLCEELFRRLNRMGVLREFTRPREGVFHPVLRVWTAIPVLLGWEPGGKPILERPVEENAENKEEGQEEETVV